MTRNNSFSPSAQMIADFAISTAHKKANMCNRHCEGSPRAWLTSKGRFKIAMFMIHSLSLTHTHTLSLWQGNSFLAVKVEQFIKLSDFQILETKKSILKFETKYHLQ